MSASIVVGRSCALSYPAEQEDARNHRSPRSTSKSDVEKLLLTLAKMKPAGCQTCTDCWWANPSGYRLTPKALRLVYREQAEPFCGRVEMGLKARMWVKAG